MATQSNTWVWIILIIIIGGAIYMNKLNIPFQSSTPIESARGQTIFLDFNDNVNPCPLVHQSQWTGIENAGNAKCYIVWTTSPEVNDDSGKHVRVENGKLKLQASSRSRSILYLNKELTNADISIYYSIYGRQDGIEITKAGINLQEIPASDESDGTSPRDGVIKIQRSFIDSNTLFVNIAGREAKHTLNPKFISINIASSATRAAFVDIDEIRYSTPTSTCLTDKNIIIYEDKFVYPSIIRWKSPKTLTYEPLRFCYDIPAWRFIDGKFAGTDFERAELYKLIASNEEYRLSVGEEINLFYAVPFVEGETPLCGLGEAYSTDLQQCIKTRFEEPIKIFQCITSADCPVPPSCNRTAITCEQNLCNGYTSVKCKEEVLVRQVIIENIKNQTLPVYVANREFIFSSFSNQNAIKDSFRIGDKSIFQSPFVSFSEPYLKRSDCNLHITNDSVWDMTCKYKINTSFLKITDIEGFRDIISNTKASYKVEVQNDYANFQNTESGFAFDCIRYTSLYEDLPTINILNGFKKGKNLYNLPIQNNLLNGEYICDLTPTIKITTDREYVFAGDEKRVFTYNIVPPGISVSPITPPTPIQPIPIPIPTPVPTPPLSNQPLIIGGAIALGLLILYSIIRRKD